MDITIHLKSIHFYLLLGVLLLFGAMGFVAAYGTNNPPVFGHTAGEIDATFQGATKTVQQALNTLDNKRVKVSGQVTCTGASPFKDCELGTTADWEACFLTAFGPVSSEGSWDAGCSIFTSGGKWYLRAEKDSGDTAECKARCIR